MIAAIDNTFLTLLLNLGAAPRPNPATGHPVSHYRKRIEALVDDLSRRKGTLLVPAPSLAEALCASDAIEAYFNNLQQYSAIEVALLMRGQRMSWEGLSARPTRTEKNAPAKRAIGSM